LHSQGPFVQLRTLQELIDVYHQTVGRNCLLMLDLTPDRSAVIPPAYAQRYKELGDFIRSCYGNSVVPSFRNSSTDSLVYMQVFNLPVSVDRSVLQEDQTHGQVIRAYTIDALLVISKDKNEWIKVAAGTSIGNKKIDLWEKGPQLIMAVRLNITNTVDTPVLRTFTVHLCT
jgi:alpha-L-fucosidase